MNTQIWGPPAWRILHGTSYLGERHVKDICTVVRCLQFVMPCAYCRDSYKGFVSAMDIDTLEDIVRRGEYSQWLYELHNKVIAKLKTQYLTESGISAEQQAVFIEKSKLPYEVLRKRLMTCVPYFSEADVLLVLGVFAYATKTVGGDERKQKFLEFTKALCALVQETLLQTDLSNRICAAISLITVENFNNEIFPALLKVELRTTPQAKDVENFCTVMSLVKAGSCSRGMCV